MMVMDLLLAFAMERGGGLFLVGVPFLFGDGGRGAEILFIMDAR